MPAIIEGPPDPGAPKGPLWRRLAWFVALAVGGLLVTAAVAYGLRAMILP